MTPSPHVSTVTSTLMATMPTEFSMTGQRLSRRLEAREGKISAGLVKRLHAYAIKCLADDGFDTVVRGWAVDVYTMEANLPVAEREYCVRFINLSGGYIELSGILNNHGWPFLNHGLNIGSN